MKLLLLCYKGARHIYRQSGTHAGGCIMLHDVLIHQIQSENNIVGKMAMTVQLVLTGKRWGCLLAVIDHVTLNYYLHVVVEHRTCGKHDEATMSLYDC